MNKLSINIGLFGVVSVGKSTFLNAISGVQYSDTEIRKTTQIPQVYLESEPGEKVPDASVIRKKNRELNRKFFMNISFGKNGFDTCQPTYHRISRLHDLFDLKIIDPNLRINIYDIPGLNDPFNKDIYFEWVRKNIKIFDIIIFITDVTRGLNNSDETDILELLLESMTKSKAVMICLMNKCDDIYYDNDQCDIVFEDEEHAKNYIYANNILINMAKKYGFEQNGNRVRAFIPISSETCFIYRSIMGNHKLSKKYLNKLGKNECGTNKWKNMEEKEKEKILEDVIVKLRDNYSTKIMDTGYVEVRKIIQDVIINNKFEFLMSHYEDNVRKLELQNIENVDEYINMIKDCRDFLEQIKSLALNSLNNAPNISNEVSERFPYTTLWKYVENTVTNYVNQIKNMNLNIVRDKDLVDVKEFDKIHCTIQNHCIIFDTLLRELQCIPEYPKSFMMEKSQEVRSILLKFYDQIFNIEPRDQIYIHPDNLLSYLEVIGTYVPDHFDRYCLKFLELNCNPKCKHLILHENKLLNLIDYICRKIRDPNNLKSIKKYIGILLLYKIHIMSNKPLEFYFHYLIKLKKLIRIYSKNYVTEIDIISEVVNKNISLLLGTNNIFTCSRVVDIEKVRSLITSNLPLEEIMEMKFEKVVLTFLGLS
ncbi:MAG: dynamin family protein [Thermoplasmata archaeon]